MGIADRLIVSDTPDVYSFCFGLLYPRICVSRGLIDALSAQELRVVLVHEREHLIQRDPLKTVIAYCLTAMAFPVPLAHTLRRLYLTARELDADRAAIATTGRTALAGALYKALTHPKVRHLSGRAAIGSISASRARLEQLVRSDACAYPGVERREVLSTAIAVFGLCAMFIMPYSVPGSSTIVDGSLPMEQRMLQMELCDVQWSDCAPEMRTEMCCLESDDLLSPCPILQRGFVPASTRSTTHTPHFAAPLLATQPIDAGRACDYGTKAPATSRTPKQSFNMPSPWTTKLTFTAAGWTTSSIAGSLRSMPALDSL